MKKAKTRHVKRSEVPEMEDLVDKLYDFFFNSQVGTDEALSAMANLIILISVGHIKEEDFWEYIKMIVDSYQINMSKFEEQ